MNGEAQFTGKEIMYENNLLSLDKFKLKFKSFVINLERRPDRMETFLKNTQQNAKFLQIERVDAIDGEKMKSTDQLSRIFDGNDFNMRKGMVGVTMSHMLLYISLMKSDYDAYLIFEDDIELTPRFDKKLYHLHLQMMKLDWDIVYLGHHYYKVITEAYEKKSLPFAEKWNAKKSLSLSMGGIAGYFISKKGAKKLMEFINKRGMTNGIDTMQQKAADELNVYYTLPHLIYSECFRGHQKIDSNIQYDFSSLSMTLEQRIQNEIDFFDKSGRELLKIVEDEEINEKISNIDCEEAFYCRIQTETRLEYLIVKTVHPYYLLERSVMVVVPGGISGRYFDRLMKNGEFDIQDAIKF